MTEKSTKKSKRSSSFIQIKQHESKDEEREKLSQNEENNIQSDIIEQTASSSSSSSSLHYYLKVSKRKFKRMFKTSLVNGQDVLQWCNSDEKLTYIHKHTCLLDRLNYLKFEQDLWENYINYGQIYECWTKPRLLKTIIEQNQLTFDYYYYSQKSMEKYLERLVQQRQEVEENIKQHRLLFKDYQHEDSTINEERLWAAILALVRKGQHKLSKHYEYRKRRFKNCAKDYQFVKACYDCQPTQEDIRSMQIIWRATKNECKSQEQVDILKQHLYLKRIPKSFDYLDQSFQKVEKKLRKLVYSNNVRATISFRHKKIIAQNKCDLITLHISMAEVAARGYHQYSEDEKKKLYEHMIKDPLRQSMANQFKEAIEKRQKHIRQDLQYLTKRRLTFFYQRSDDRPLKWYRRSYHLNLNWDILPSSPIIEVFTQLTSEQLALLAYGPKYVAPCQSRFYSKEKREKIIEQEYQTMINTIKEFFRQHCFYISEKRLQEFSIDLKQLLQHLYTKKVARKLYIRSKREHKLIVGIRRYLHQNQHIILRRTDKSKVFHLGDANDYQEKVLQYMQDTEAYEEITSGISPLATNFRQVTSLLDSLYHIEQPLLTKKQYEIMYPKIDEIELGHVYFVPKPHKVCYLIYEKFIRFTSSLDN